MDLVRRWDPERIGPYAILRRLGAGAMGQVYLGRSVAGRLVAVKTIRPELAEEEGFRTRFAQEVAAARRVSGVFTASVVEADADADVPWLATAYVPAPSLRRLVEECGPLPPATVRWLAAGCAEALESIHGAGLVHMDLKPSNVLVATDGLKVIDFGVARAAARVHFTRGSAAKGGGTIGTPAYMAPEQAQDITQVSGASDIFSLGATLLYAATGHAPYTGETTADVLVRLATEPPDLAGLPAEVAGLITSCLNRSPRQRPTPAAVLSLLGEFSESKSYLPDSAFPVIEEYRHVTDQPPASLSESEETAPSVPGLPASAKPEMRQPSLRRTWRRLLELPARAAWAIAGAVLVGGGVILGATLSGSSGPASSTGPLDHPPPSELGPSCGSSAGAGPGLCVDHPEGALGAVFTVRSSGFKPGSSVHMTLFFYPPPPPSSGAPPAAQTVGTYTVAANGQVQLSRLKLGLYRMVASGPSGTAPSTVFRVDP